MLLIAKEVGNNGMYARRRSPDPVCRRSWMINDPNGHLQEREEAENVANSNNDRVVALRCRRLKTGNSVLWCTRT